MHVTYTKHILVVTHRVKVEIHVHYKCSVVMRVCVRLCMCTCVRAFACIRVRACVWVCMRVCARAYVQEGVCVCGMGGV